MLITGAVHLFDVCSISIGCRRLVTLRNRSGGGAVEHPQGGHGKSDQPIAEGELFTHLPSTVDYHDAGIPQRLGGHMLGMPRK